MNILRSTKSPHDNIVYFLKHYDTIIVNAKEEVDIWIAFVSIHAQGQGRCLVKLIVRQYLHYIGCFFD